MSLVIVHRVGISFQRFRTPLTSVADQTVGTTVATVSSVRYFGLGASRRAVLVLTDTAGREGMAMVSADRLSTVPDFLLAPGTEVAVRGVVRHFPRTPVLDLASIRPAARERYRIAA
ncbi:hypothetical protein ACTWQF_34140 [Streptomyces sp. 8N114]|uniref:hypothetical protein n=1 Tax=Streptomyces sp. 8N114 TaxID=3457419 RepID=UPI003FD6308F